MTIPPRIISTDRISARDAKNGVVSGENGSTTPLLADVHMTPDYAALQSFVQASTQPVLMLMQHSGGQPTIEFANSAFMHETGMLFAPPNVHYISSILDAACIDDFNTAFTRATQSRSTVQVPVIEVAMDGRRWHCSGTLTWFNAGVGNAGAILGFCNLSNEGNILWDWQELATQARCLVWYALITKNNDQMEWDIHVVNPDAAIKWMPIDARPGETFGSAWNRCRVEEDLKRINESFRNALLTGLSTYAEEFRCVCADGSVRMVSERARIYAIAENQWKVVGVCTDVTDARAMDEALNHSQSRLALHVAQTHLGVVEWDLNGTVCGWNPTAVEIFGYEPCEAMGKHARDLIIVTSAPHAEWTAFLSRGERETLINRTSTGKLIHCEWSNSVIVDSAGTATGYTSFVQDITVRIETEELLKRESSLLNALMDNIPDNVYIKDKESRFLKVSRRMAQKKCGLEDPNDAIGKTDFELFTIEHAQPAFDDEQRIMRTRVPVINKIEKETFIDGHETWCSTTKAPIFDRDGEVIGTVGISRDITERLKEEESRRRADAETQTLMNSARCLVWHAHVVREADAFEWQINLSNAESALRWLPIEMDTTQPFGASWKNAIHSQDLPQVDQTSENALRSGASGYTQEYRIRLANGDLRWIAEHVNIEVLPDCVYRLVGVCTDITEQKLANLELRHLVNSARCVLWHANLEIRDEHFYWDVRFSDESTVLKWLPIALIEGRRFSDSWFDALTPEDQARSNRLASDAVVSGVAGYKQEYQLRLEDGTVTWIAEQVHIEALEKGKWRLVGVCMDITEQKLIETELRHLITNLQCLVWHAIVKEFDGCLHWDFTIANEEAARRWLDVDSRGYETFVDAFLQARASDDPASLQSRIGIALQSGSSSFVQDFQCRVSNGEDRWLSETVQIESLEPGTWRLVGLCSDVSEYKIAEAALAKERNMLRTLVDNLPDAIYGKDIDGRFTLSNAAHLEFLGAVGSADVAGKSDEDFFPKGLAERYRRDERDVMVNGIPLINVEEPQLDRDGNRRFSATTKVPLRDGDGKIVGLVGVSRDITQRRAMEEERERLLADALERADRDPLTGLLNHRAFHKRLEEEAERSTRQGTSLGIAMMDLDNFKFFNDAYGHSVGDDVLCQVARGLRSSCRTYDILARFGGDEFALLMPGSGPIEAQQMAERIKFCMDGVGYTPPGYDVAIPLSVSIGLSVFPLDADNRHDALAIADDRLIRSKTGGDDTADLSERMRHILMASSPNFSMLNALVSAVDNKDRYTRRHSDDVLSYSLQIAQELNLDEDAQHIVQVAALLHDVGKIGVPDSILRKPGKLSDDEYSAIKQHPTMGAIIVGAVAGFENTLDAVRHHHERWDGNGYPYGLKGLEIPVIARLMAVADAYSAMTTDRPYRKGLSTSRALSILINGAGSQWDPECVDALVRARRLRANEVPTPS